MSYDPEQTLKASRKINIPHHKITALPTFLRKHLTL